MDQTVGVLGGGQLGRMLTEAANRLNVKVVTLGQFYSDRSSSGTHAEGSPAKQINASRHVNGSFKDAESIRLLAEQCDVLTVEIEHVDTDVLEELAEGIQTKEDWRSVKGPKVEIQPHWQTIRTIQDKYAQKEHLIEHAIATAHSIPLQNSSLRALEGAAKELGFPFMLKSRTEAYDGRGNYPVTDQSRLHSALHTLHNRPLYAETWAKFSMELAVMVVKTDNDVTESWQKSTLAFPVVETVHEESICKLVYAPARGISESIAQQAQELARSAVATFKGKGVFGVEMFLLEDRTLLINEIAPRPHNSGHYTIEACPMSQYDAHLSAILNLPIPKECLELRTPSIMLNILGGATPDSHRRAAQEALSIPGRSIHMYGKGDARPGRKMGHITVTAGSMAEVERRIDPLIRTVDQIRTERSSAGAAAETVKSTKASKKDENLAKPLVAVTMGSDSDLPVLRPGLELLEELDIPFEVRITSAHRTPDLLFQFVEEATANGIKVIIAAAGGAAHIAGMAAAKTWLPVIGVPVKTSTLDGVDSLYSMVQMPRGCPVACVAINNSVNAAQTAIRILATSDTAIRERLQGLLKAQMESVIEKDKKIQRLGFKAYGSTG